jgi:hypothetical protein
MTQRTNFTQIPNEAQDDLRMNCYEFTLLSRIYRYEKVTMSKSELARISLQSRKKLDQSLERLIELGWIIKDAKGDYERNWDNQKRFTQPSPVETISSPVETSPTETIIIEPSLIETISSPVETSPTETIIIEPSLIETIPSPVETVTVANRDDSVAAGDENVAVGDAYNKKEIIKENTITNTASEFPYPSFSFLLKDLEKAGDRHLRRKAFFLDFHHEFAKYNLPVPEGRPDNVWCGEFDNVCRKLNFTNKLTSWTSQLEKEIQVKITEGYNKKQNNPFSF